MRKKNEYKISFTLSLTERALERIKVAVFREDSVADFVRERFIEETEIRGRGIAIGAINVERIH